MVAFFHRIGPRLLLITLAFLLVLAAATAFVVQAGFHQTASDAAAASRAGLEAQGRAALLDRARYEAGTSAAQFQQVAALGHVAARYMVEAPAHGIAPAPGSLRQYPNGAYADPNPARITDLWAPNWITQ